VYRSAFVTQDNNFFPTELGMALVASYMDMQVPLYQPHLRAEMEKELVRIAEGQRTKNEVIHDAVQKHKELYLKVKQSLDVMSLNFRK
jgi:DNA topoisomerase-3